MKTVVLAILEAMLVSFVIVPLHFLGFFLGCIWWPITYGFKTAKRTLNRFFYED